MTFPGSNNSWTYALSIEGLWLLCGLVFAALFGAATRIVIGERYFSRQTFVLLFALIYAAIFIISTIFYSDLEKDFYPIALQIFLPGPLACIIMAFRASSQIKADINRYTEMLRKK